MGLRRQAAGDRGARLPPGPRLPQNTLCPHRLGLSPPQLQVWCGSEGPTPTPCLASGHPAGAARTGSGVGVPDGSRAWGLVLKLKKRDTTFSWIVYLLGVAGGAGEVWGGLTFPSATPRTSHCSGKLFRPQKPHEPCVGGTEGQGSEMPSVSWLQAAVLGDGSAPSHRPVLVVSRMPGGLLCP